MSITVRRTILIGVALAAVAIRLAPLARGSLDFAFPPGEPTEFAQLAAGLTHGCGFARLIHGDCQPPEILRTPAYPLFLALAPSVRWALVTQAVLSASLCLVVAGLVLKFWNFPAALMAELIVVFDCPSIIMADQVIAETLFQVAIAIAVMAPLCFTFQARGRLATTLIASVSAALAILLRPIAIILPLIMPLPFLAPLSLRRRLSMTAIAALIPLMALCGWSLRNYQETGYLGLSTVGAINLYYFRAADVVARNKGVDLETTVASFGQRLGIRYSRIYAASVQSPQLAARMVRLAVPELTANLVTTCAMTLESTADMALSPMRSRLAEFLGTAGGGTQWSGLAAGPPSFGRLFGVFRETSKSPLLTALVIFQTLMLIFVWIGIARAVVLSLHASVAYRLWTLYPAALAISNGRWRRGRCAVSFAGDTLARGSGRAWLLSALRHDRPAARWPRYGRRGPARDEDSVAVQSRITHACANRA